MADKIAQEIISEWQREDSAASNTMQLCQQIADHFFQRENQITTIRTPGEDKSLPILDPTGQKDLEEMVAGMVAIIIPHGQFFFKLAAQDYRQQNLEEISSYLNYCTEIMHQQMFGTNFLEQFAEWMFSLVGFGTGNLFSGWDKHELGLFYKDWDIANYRFGVDYKGRPSRCLVRWFYTAEQAVEKFGDAAGPDVIKAATDSKRSQEKFAFIWRCRQRKNRDTTKTDNLNAKFEEVVINEKEKVKVAEEGYPRFPYKICRWQVTSQSIWGEGRGGMALSADKDLQRQKKAYLFSVDMANTPPYEYMPLNCEGAPKIYPGAGNPVMQLDSIRALDGGRLNGNAQQTLELIKDTRSVIDGCFYVKVFRPSDDMKSHVTNLQIMEFVKAGRIQLVLPCTRIYNEGLTPTIIDSFHHLLDNHILPPPPEGLQSLKIEYLGSLAMALQEQQSDALQRYAQFSLAMEPIMPGFTEETINRRRAGKRIGRTFGMAEDDFTTEEEYQQIMAERAKKEQAQQMMMAAQTASKSYKDASGKAEEGSPAEALMAGAGK